MRHGDLAFVDQNRELWTKLGWGERDLKRFDAMIFLDLDDPQSTLSLVTSREMRGFGRHLYAEAHRREGDPDNAMMLLEANTIRTVEGVQAEAVRARCLVDEGHLEDAKEILDRYPPDAAMDIVASRWYLAHMTHDPAEAALSEAWKRLNVNPLRSLEQLIPLPVRQ